MIRRPRRPLTLHPVGQFTDPSPAVEKNVAALRDDLIGRGYDRERAERLARLASNPATCLAYTDGASTRRSDLPGGAA